MSALMLFGDTERSAALRHEIPIAIIDALLWLELDGRRVVLTSQLEQTRIAKVLPEAEILDYFAFGMRELRQQGLSHAEAEREVVARVVRDLGLSGASVPGDFPVALADRLRADGLALTVDEAAIAARRRSKTGQELEGIRAAQRAAEAGMAAAEAMLARAEPGTDGRLYLAGEELHAEHVRAALRQACAEHGAPCPPDVMVASVWDGFGHESGSGPLPAGLPIQVDLWPRDEESGCWADMTRTFCAGEPPPEIAEYHRACLEVLERVLGEIRPGVTGEWLHQLADGMIADAGYPTLLTKEPGKPLEDGFFHTLGHGVGLEIHEAPTLRSTSTDVLEPGHVVTVEPGIYLPGWGGVRIEDLTVVTGGGAETLSRSSRDLVVL